MFPIMLWGLLWVLLLKEVDSKSYGGHQLWKITPQSLEHLEELSRLHRELSHQLDFWSSPSKLYQSVSIAVPPSHQPSLHDHLKQHGLESHILIGDLQKLIDQEKTEMNSTASGTINQTNEAGGINLATYHRYEEMMNFMEEIHKKYPSITRLFDIGKSFEGRDLKGIQIGSQKAKHPKPAMYIDAGIHAREWAAPAAALFIINELTSKYDKDQKIRELLDNLDWYIIPLANPDGYEYTFKEDRYWRKTRSIPEGCKSENDCCFGADPNRNWGYHFGGKGTSPNPCSEIYPGKTAFSEPETKALAGFLTDLKDQLKGYITLHSYSQLWLVPFGYETDKYPDNFDQLISAAREAEAAVEKENGMHYKVENSATLYPAAGASDDWVKGVLGIEYVYTIELRPNEDVNDIRGFSLKEEQIIPTSREIFQGIKVIANKIIQEANGTKPTTMHAG